MVASRITYQRSQTVAFQGRTIPYRAGSPLQTSFIGCHGVFRIADSEGETRSRCLISLLAALAALAFPLILEIRQQRGSVRLLLGCNPDESAELVAAIRGSVAAWDVRDCVPAPIPAHLCRLGAFLTRGAPNWQPLLALADNTFADPLLAILEAGAPTDSDEHLLVRLVARPVSSARRTQIREALTGPPRSSDLLVSLAQALSPTPAPLAGFDKPVQRALCLTAWAARPWIYVASLHWPEPDNTDWSKKGGALPRPSAAYSTRVSAGSS